MSAEKSNAGEIGKNRVKILVFDIDDILITPEGIDWPMAAIAWAAKNDGYKLAITSKRNPEKFLQWLMAKWDAKQEPIQNVKNLISFFKKINLSTIFASLHALGVDFDEICLGGVWLANKEEHKQIEFETKVFELLQKSLVDISKLNEFESLAKSYRFDVLQNIGSLYDELSAKYSKNGFIHPFCFIGKSKYDEMDFNGSLKANNFVKHYYNYDRSPKQRRTILAGLSLDAKVLGYYKWGKYLISNKKEAEKASDIYAYFWASSCVGDIHSKENPNAVEIVQDLFILGGSLPRLFYLFSIRFPDYTHQYFLKLIYDVYPFKEQEKPFQVSQASFKLTDGVENRGRVAEIGFEKEEELYEALSDILNNNNNQHNGSIESSQHYHFRKQRTKQFSKDDFDGPKVEFYIERGCLLVDVALHELYKEQARFREKNLAPMKSRAYREILVKIHALQDVFNDFSASIRQLWAATGLSDESFKDANGLFGPSKEVGVTFKKFHKKALKLLHNLIRQIIGTQVLDRELIDTADLPASFDRIKQKIKEGVKSFRKKESVYIAENRQRPVLSHEFTLHMPNKPLSKVWMYHVPVGRYTSQQLMSRFYKNLADKLEELSGAERTVFNKKLDEFLGMCKESSLPILKKINENFTVFLKQKNVTPVKLLNELISYVNIELREVKDPLYLNAAFYAVYELVADLIKEFLKINEYYTAPSSERCDHGSSNSLQTDAYVLDEQGLHTYFTAFRSSSAPPIDLEIKKEGGESWPRLWISYTNIRQDLELFANKQIKASEKQSGKPLDPSTYSAANPMVVKVAWASLLSPLGGGKMAKIGGTFSEQTEYSQLLEIDIIRRIMQASPELINVDGKLIWARFEIHSINKAVNEARGLTNTFSDLQDEINTEGYYKLAQAIDESLQTLLEKQNFLAAQTIVNMLRQQLAVCQKDKIVLQKKTDVERIQARMNALAVELSGMLQQLSFQSILQSDVGSALFIKRAKELRRLEKELKEACQAYLKQRKIALDDKGLKKVIQELEQFNEKHPDYKNKDFQKLVDIFSLKHLLWRMLDTGDADKDDEYCYWFVAYYLCLLKELDPDIVIKFHCKSAEDRTGTLEDYFRAIQEFRITNGFYPKYFVPGQKETINHIRKQLYQKAPNRPTNNENAPGSFGLQVGNQFFQDFDNLIAKLAKKAVKAKVSGKTPLPVVVYNHPILLNEYKAVLLKHEEDFKAENIERLNQNIYQTENLEILLYSELQEAGSSEELKNIFYHDLVLRFWMCLSKMSMMGSDYALFVDAQDFAAYQEKKSKTFMSRFSNGRFQPLMEEELAKFFHIKLQQICNSKVKIYNTFIVLTRFIEHKLNKQEKDAFMTVLSKSFNSNFYHSKLNLVVSEELKMQYKQSKSGRLFYSRYILPYFYMINNVGGALDFTHFVDQIEILRGEVKDKEILSLDAREIVEENCGQIGRNIIDAVENLVLLSKSKSTKEDEFDQHLSNIFSGLILLVSNINCKENVNNSYLSEIKEFISRLSEKSELYIQTGQRTLTRYQQAMTFFNHTRQDLFNLVQELAPKYGVVLGTIAIVNQETSLLESVNNLLSVIWASIENVLPQKGEQKNYELFASKLQSFAEVFEASCEACEKVMTSISQSCSVNKIKAENFAMMEKIYEENFEKSTALKQGLKKLPSQKSYEKVNFELDDETNGTNHVPSGVATSISNQRLKMTGTTKETKDAENALTIAMNGSKH